MVLVVFIMLSGIHVPMLADFKDQFCMLGVLCGLKMLPREKQAPVVFGALGAIGVGSLAAGLYKLKQLNDAQKNDTPLFEIDKNEAQQVATGLIVAGVICLVPSCLGCFGLGACT